MNPEYQPFIEAKAEKQISSVTRSSRSTKIQRAVLVSVLGCLGCAAHQPQVAPSGTYFAASNMDHLLIADPALVTFEEIAMISSDRISPTRLQQLTDRVEITEGNIRFHRIQIARQTDGSHPAPSFKTLIEEKRKLEAQAQEVINIFCTETQFCLPYSRLRLPDSFRIQSLFDAEETFQNDRGRFNTYLLHQMKSEEMKLRHLRLLLWFCRQERELSEEERAFHIRQLETAKVLIEDSIQLLQNAFYRNFQK